MRSVCLAVGMVGICLGVMLTQQLAHAAVPPPPSRSKHGHSSAPPAASPTPLPLPDFGQFDPTVTPFRIEPIEPDSSAGIVLNGVMSVGGQALDTNELVPVLGFGADIFYYHRYLEAGLGLSAHALFGPASALTTVLAGLKVDSTTLVRFELLAEGGAHFVTEIGRDMFARPLRDASVVLPYVGGRAGLTYLIGRRHRFLLGGWFTMGRDLTRETVTVPVETCFLGCDTNLETHTVGGANWSIGIRIGGVPAKF